MSFNFFASNKKFHAEYFDMQDQSDLNMYERINNRVHVDKEDGWKIVGEQPITDKDGNLYIFLKWIQPLEG